MGKRRLYFDNAATTMLDPRVLHEMISSHNSFFGNPSSLHSFGVEAKGIIEKSRETIALLIRAEKDEIYFTGSGTEADNLALIGVFEKYRERGVHIIVSSIEHPAILSCCSYLEERGALITKLPVDEEGRVNPDDLRKEMTPQTRLVSVMAANNVTGVIQSVEEMARIAHDHGAFFHTDAVQYFGKVPIDVSQFDADLMSMSAHKIHGPKGVGALFVRKGVEISPVMHGGGQERGIRSSTENTAGIVGFAKAAVLCTETMADDSVSYVRMREKLFNGIMSIYPGAYMIGHRYMRLPGHLCVGFSGLEQQAIKLMLDLDEKGIAVSLGSACSSNHADKPSEIMQRMGYDPVRAKGAMRISLGRFNSDGEVDYFLEVLSSCLKKLKRVS